jgi:hypothetical protein
VTDGASLGGGDEERAILESVYPSSASRSFASTE